VTRHAAAETRRAQILEAALACFASRGLNAATIDDVARAAGLSKGAVYHHFASKQEIFLALADAYEEAIFGEWKRSDDLPALEALRHAGEFALAKLAGSRALVGVWTEFLRDKSARRRLARVYRRSRALLAEQLRCGIANGELADCDVESTAAGLTALVEGLLVQALADSAFDPRAAWPGAFDLVARALAPTPAQGRRGASRGAK